MYRPFIKIIGEEKGFVLDRIISSST